MRPVLRAIGLVILVLVGCMIALFAYLGYQARKVGRGADAIKPGMTIDQAVAVFPANFFTASISVPLRTEVCKDASGRVVPPDEYPILFPDMPEGDKEGEELSWNARQIPVQLDRMELLDKHLRGRKDWPILVKVWTANIQDEEDHPEPVSYCRRGTAYLALNDFNHGYKDLRSACKMGSKESCAEVAKLPKDKIAAFEAHEQRIIDKAPACEPEVSSFSLRRAEKPDEFGLQVYTPHSSGIPASKTVSRAELTVLLKREFAGREWRAGFTFLTATPQHLSFHFVVGRDGKVKEVSPVQSWD